MKSDQKIDITIDEFVKILHENVDNFRSNMQNLKGNFIKEKTFEDWMEVFSNWSK